MNPDEALALNGFPRALDTQHLTEVDPVSNDFVLHSKTAKSVVCAS